MAKALDRVKAAEAKYTAMGETAEKLESTLKKFKGTADLCYAAMRELHREIKKDQKDQRWAFWWFVLMAGIVAVVGGFLGNFLRSGPCEPWMPWGLGGEADANLRAARRVSCGVVWWRGKMWAD